MGFVTVNRAFDRPPTNASPRKLLATVTAGFVFLTIPLFMVLIDPILFIAKKNTHVSNGSLVHKLLMHEMVSVHVATYLFNVTNAERFQKGLDEKMKVEEVGPFTYSELRSHDDLEIDEAGGVIKYTPKLRTVFLPNESIADPHNVTVTMPNVAMLSMVGMAANYPFFSKMAFNMLASNIKSKAFVTLPAHNFLWGYEDPLIALGNTVMPGWIFFDTLGILDRMYDRKNHHRLVVGGRDDDKFEVKSVDGFDGLTQWGYEDPEKRTKCNTFKNGYEGIGYPTELTPDKEIRIFRNILCRFLELDFQEKVTMFGGDALSYKISNRTFTLNDDTECLCGKGMCIEGISDISPCFYGLPLAISNAHFMGFPKLREKIEGLKPDIKKHGSKFLIEPKIGMVLDTEFSLQLNVVIGDSTYNHEAKHLSNMVVPVMYFKIMAAVPQESIDNVRMMYITGPKIFLALEIISVVLGLILLAYSARIIYWNWLWSEGKGISFHLPSDSKDAHILSVEIPLMDMVDPKE